MDITAFKHLNTINLHHQGDCVLLGSTLDGKIWVDIWYEDEQIARYTLLGDAIIAIQEIVDDELPVWTAPVDGYLPQNAVSAHALNLTASRLRGLREQDRISEWIQPLSIAEKMTFIQDGKLQLSPMQLLGIADSHVLALAQLPDQTQIVCRRIRLAYALAKIEYDPHPYDYDTMSLYIVHEYDPRTDEAPMWEQPLNRFAGVILNRPMDCLLMKDRFIVADSSHADHPCRILVWSVHPNLP